MFVLSKSIKKITKTTTMKKIFLAVLVIGCTLFAKASEPNEKVLNAFNKTFPSVQDVSWSENAYSFDVRFKQNQIVTRVTYDKEGTIVRTMRYYKEEHLPILVMTKVKQRFAGKNIYGVTEITKDGETSYHIILDDEKQWYDITSDTYGSIMLNKKFRKA